MMNEGKRSLHRQKFNNVRESNGEVWERETK